MFFYNSFQCECVNDKTWLTNINFAEPDHIDAAPAQEKNFDAALAAPTLLYCIR
jgi:hypothetical protein